MTKRLNSKECGVTYDPEPALLYFHTEILLNNLFCTRLIWDFPLILSSVITPRNLFLWTVCLFF